MKDLMKRIGLHVWALLGEWSTWKGLLLIVTAIGWWDLDNNSRGEAIAQGGLMLYGIINAALPNTKLYRQ